MSFIEEVEAKREENINTYKTTTTRFIADYNSENAIKEDYKGRQLLELLQNADDARAVKVKITKDAENRTIKICNMGDPFSVNGFGALMLAYCGTKSAGKKDFIGNKGLGFRSILNWAESVDVKSNGCRVHFSRETAYEIAREKLGSCWNVIQQQIDSKGLVQDKIAPILSLPRIESCLPSSEGWVTEIIIQYNNDSKIEEDINEQIKLITSKTLLFVRNIRLLEIVGFGEDRYFSSSVTHYEKYDEIKIIEQKRDCETEHKYRLFKKEGIVPEEIQKKEQGANLTRDPMYYEVCLAIDGEIGNKEYLYSYFKTNIEIELPCIIHAAFRLDSSRKYLIENSIINDFLIEKVLEEFEVVSNYLCETETKSWHAYKLTCLKNKPDESKTYLKKLYDGLEKFRYNHNIYPCVDGRYRDISDVRYYEDGFSSFIELNYCDIFPEMLCATKGVCVEEIGTYEELDIWEKLDEICGRKLLVEQRVELLKVLTNPIVIQKIPNTMRDAKSTEKKHKLSLLVDDDGKVIPANKSIYTAPEKPLIVPKFLNISYVSKAMYEMLKTAFPLSFGLNGLGEDNQETDNLARHICDSINHYVYMRAYDVAALIPEIISKTNKRIESLDDEKDKQISIIAAVQSLYNNYKESGRIRAGSENKYAGLQLLAKDGSIRKASTLYLSKSYKSGEITESFYGNLIKEYEYVAGRDVYKIKIPSGSNDGFEDFLVLCGVSRFLKYDMNYQLDSSDVDSVDINYLNECLICDAYRMSRKKPNAPVCKLMDVDKLNSLKLTNLLILICKEDCVYDEIIHGTRLLFSQAHAQGQYDEHVDMSLVSYQMRSRFSDIVFQKDDSEINFLLNPSGEIDYDLLHRYDIESKADSVLQKLGAKKTFQELSPASLYGIIRRVEENKDRYPNGRRIPKIYGDVYDILKKQPTHDHGELMLACRKNGIVEFKKNSEVYYYDDATLPRSILEKYPILLLRQRAGVDQVVSYFGVQRLDVSSLEIDERLMDEDKDRSREFNDYYKERVPFIVMHRIRGLNKNLSNEARKANITFHILNNGEYSFNKLSNELKEYEFIVQDKNAYIRVPNLPVKNLVYEKQFLEAFSEILGITFALDSVELNKIFKTILRDDVTTLLADVDDDRDDYELALESLGRYESRELEFWNKILNKKNEAPYKINQGKYLEDYIQEKLNFKFSGNYRNVDFSRFDDEDSINFVREIHKEVGLNFEDILPAEGFIPYHKEKLNNCANSLYSLFRSLLWKKLNSEDEECKKTYCKSCFEYEYFAKSIPLEDFKYEDDVNYDELLKQEVLKKFEIDLNKEMCKEYKGILYENYKEGLDNSLPIEERSLLYFEGYDDKFRRIEIETKEDEPDEENSPISGEVGVLKPVVKDPSKRKPKDKNPWNNNEKENGKKKKAGKKAQEIVLQYLKEKYGEECCRLRSSESDDPGKSDGAHYDILYCESNPPSSEALWRYLEVKNAASDSFFMSEAEVSFGCQEENQKKYDLALVKGKKVQIVKSFFKGMTIESFEKEYKPLVHRDFFVSFEFEAINDSNE